MSDFIVENLTKSVGDKTVFTEISFIVHDLDRIGIIGVNGTGKTTLLDVISGKLGFDGDVSPFSSKSGYKVAYLTQEPDFEDDKTILDTVLSSDLREMALIKEYERLMSDYSEEEFNILDSYLVHDRDMQFAYAAVKQLEGKYLLQNRVTGEIYESPQFLYILVAACLFAKYPRATRLDYVKRFYDAVLLAVERKIDSLGIGFELAGCRICGVSLVVLDNVGDVRAKLDQLVDGIF